MNHQTIIDLAIAEGLTFIPEANCPLARIVRKAVAMERDACAKVVSDYANDIRLFQNESQLIEAERLIRARSAA